MKKLIIAAATLACIGAVFLFAYAIADDSVLISLNSYKYQRVDHRPHIIYNVLSPSDDPPTINSTTGNSSTTLSMLMIGLTLVGLASFRQNDKDRHPDSTE